MNDNYHRCNICKTIHIDYKPCLCFKHFTPMLKKKRRKEFEFIPMRALTNIPGI